VFFSGLPEFESIDRFPSFMAGNCPPWSSYAFADFRQKEFSVLLLLNQEIEISRPCQSTIRLFRIMCSATHFPTINLTGQISVINLALFQELLWNGSQTRHGCQISL
jgi:hypothetical protein